MMDDFHIPPKMPMCVHYIPNFISVEQETEIMAKVYEAPKPKWTQLSGRRLQNWGGIPHPKGMIAEPIPDWLSKYMSQLIKHDIFPHHKDPNHVLINEYLPGQGIMRHFDGPLFESTICTISCNSHTVLNFHKPNVEDVCHSLLLERRSLVVIQEDLYKDYQHSIDPIEEDKINDEIANLNLTLGNYQIGDVIRRDTRISLTIRHVPLTTKFQLKLSKK